MRKIIFLAFIASLLAPRLAQAEDWQYKSIYILTRAVGITEQSKKDRCDSQKVESVKTACIAGFNMAIARQRALIAELEYMVKFDAISNRGEQSRLKDAPKNSVSSTSAYDADVNNTQARLGIIETQFNKLYSQ